VPQEEQKRSADLAQKALGYYGLPRNLLVTLINLSENETYKVEDAESGTQWALRIHRPGYHSRNAIASEIVWLLALRKDLVVATPQKGLVMGLEFNHPEGAVHVSRALYEHGIWAMFSSLDKRVLQFKAGLLLSVALCQEILDRFDAAMPKARELFRKAAET
jgi:hypothetical protein